MVLPGPLGHQVGVVGGGGVRHGPEGGGVNHDACISEEQFESVVLFKTRITMV